MKINVSTSVEESDYKRIERLAEADGSDNISWIARKAIVKGLPLIEEEVFTPRIVRHVAQRKNGGRKKQAA